MGFELNIGEILRLGLFIRFIELVATLAEQVLGTFGGDVVIGTLTGRDKGHMGLTVLGVWWQYLIQKVGSWGAVVAAVEAHHK